MLAYRMTSSLDVVQLPEGAVLLRSDLGSCRIEGESARLLAVEVLPRLSEWTVFEDLAAALKGYDPDDVRSLLDSLVGSSLLLKSNGIPDGSTKGARFLAELGFGELASERRLTSVRVGLAGRTRGALLIQNALEQFGVDSITAFGEPDQPALSKEAMFAAAEHLDLIIVAVDRAMLAARHWANQAAIKTGCAALFVDISALEAVVGPTLLPGESSCYTCFKMRQLATSDAFGEVMAHEQYFDALKNPNIERMGFPGLSEMAAGAAVAEAVRLLFPPLTPWLANAVLRIDPSTLSFERHDVLRQPDCPHCRGTDHAVRAKLA